MNLALKIYRNRGMSVYPNFTHNLFVASLKFNVKVSNSDVGRKFSIQRSLSNDGRGWWLPNLL